MAGTVLTFDKNLEKKRKNTPHQTSDYQYYNIRLYNPIDSNAVLKAEYKENRTIPILDKPSDYELAVVRFTIPGQIPIFIYPDEDVLKVQLEYLGVFYPVSLIYIPQCVGCLYGKGIYNYQYFADIVNTALATAYADMKAAAPGAPPTEAPYLTFDATSQLFTFNAEVLYETTPVNIYFSEQLYNGFFPSFNAFSDVTSGNPLSGWTQILIEDYKNNSATIGGKAYYSTLQEFTTLALWNSFVSIVLESDTIPIEPEFQPSQTNVVRRIITDFEPSSEINNRQNFQFFPQGALRYYDLKSDYPMRSIDLKVFLRTKDDTNFLLHLGPGQYLTVKILFRRKKALILADTLDPDQEDE